MTNALPEYFTLSTLHPRPATRSTLKMPVDSNVKTATYFDMITPVNNGVFGNLNCRS
jgi:hypothetical protein